MGSNPKPKKPKRSGSRILWEITVLVLIVFIISACLSWFFYNRSTNEVMENNREKLIRVQATNMTTTFGFITYFLGDLVAQEMEARPDLVQALIPDIMSKNISDIQRDVNVIMRRMVDLGTLGMSEASVALPATPPVFDEPTIIMSSNPDHMYESIPASLLPLYESKDRYLFLEDGIPEWGLKDEQLVVYCESAFVEGQSQKVMATGIKPMHAEMESINSYYEKQKRNINIIMWIVIASSLVVLFFITFFALSYLIRRRITRPIDELSAVAERVMEGELDVQIPIREGEEFEGLKRAFSAMLDSIRKVVSKAFDEDAD